MTDRHDTLTMVANRMRKAEIVLRMRYETEAADDLAVAIAALEASPAPITQPESATVLKAGGGMADLAQSVAVASARMIQQLRNDGNDEAADYLCDYGVLVYENARLLTDHARIVAEMDGQLAALKARFQTSGDESTSAYNAASKRADALAVAARRLMRAFIIAVGDTSPFAKAALQPMRDALNTKGD